MKTSRAVTVRFALLSIAVVAMLVLAMGLSQVDLAPGVPFDQIWQFLIDQFSLGGVMGPMYGSAAGGQALVDVLRTIFFVALMVLPIAIILVLIDPELRKRVLRSALRLLVLFALLGIVLKSQIEKADEALEPFGTGLLGREGIQAAEPLTDEEFSAEMVSPWVARGLSLGVGLILAAVVVGLVSRLRRDRSLVKDPWAEIGRQAQAAAIEIQQGGDLQHTILRCYAEMSRVVTEQRGVRRQAAVTAREFTNYLVRARLPEAPVVRLTELFEKARYGSGECSAQEESDAVLSLQAIADACQILS
jgi:hypothetical protein